MIAATICVTSTSAVPSFTWSSGDVRPPSLGSPNRGGRYTIPTVVVSIAGPALGRPADWPVGRPPRCYVPAKPTPKEADAMATATDTLKNFVDGEFVDAAEGRTSAVINPATGEEIAQAPDSTAEDVDRAVKAARRPRSRRGAARPPASARCAAQARRRDRGQRGRDRRARVGQRRQAAAGVQGRRDPGDGRQPALLRRRRARAWRARPRASTSRATRRSSAASPSASPARSRRGTTR